MFWWNSIIKLVILKMVTSNIDSTLLCLLARTNRLIDENLASHLILCKWLHYELITNKLLSCCIYRMILLVACLIYSCILYTLLVWCNLIPPVVLYPQILYWFWLAYRLSYLLGFMLTELVVEVSVSIQYVLRASLIFHLMKVLKVLVAFDYVR